MILALMMSLAAAPHSGLVKTTVLSVRVRVVETCRVSPAAIRCRDAEAGPAPRVYIAADGAHVVEF